MVSDRIRVIDLTSIGSDDGMGLKMTSSIVDWLKNHNA
jgi:hypothetical protein